MNWLIKLESSFLDIVFPTICLNCRRYLDSTEEKENLLCEQCFESIIINRFIFREGSLILGAVSNYRNEALQSLIHFLKYQGFLATNLPIRKLIKAYLEKSNFREFADENHDFQIVPIPLYPSRLKKRGFNQATIISRELSKETGWPIREDALRRIKNTRPQAKTFNNNQREENLKDSFLATIRNASSDNFIIVDDVYTSGATLNEAVKALRKAGAKKVFGFVLAKA